VTADAVDIDLARAAADLQHAIHLIGVAADLQHAIHLIGVAADLQHAIHLIGVAADLQHAIHLIGVAPGDPARADLLAEARTLIDCASDRLAAPAVSDPDPEPGVQSIAAWDLRIGDRFYVGNHHLRAVRGIERRDDGVVLFLEGALHSDDSAPVGSTHQWPNTLPVHVLTPRPGDDGSAS